MNEEKFQALYKNTKKEEIIKELYFKCKANYKLEDIIKEVREYGESCMNEILSAQIEENPYKFTLYVCLAVHRRYLEILGDNDGNI